MSFRPSTHPPSIRSSCSFLSDHRPLSSEHLSVNENALQYVNISEGPDTPCSVHGGLHHGVLLEPGGRRLVGHHDHHLDYHHLLLPGPEGRCGVCVCCTFEQSTSMY